MTVNFLKKTLGECKRADSICENSTSYETVSLTEFFVIDGASGHPVRISKDENDNHLTVTNSKSSTLTLIKVDSCLIHGNKEKKCDCILFNNKKIFFYRTF
ncbi:MAG: hypothetical protein IPN68_16695 [Bacteroidetes bacterium]|nr:hypothetical protein [Bacteroidota bacterium]